MMENRSKSSSSGTFFSTISLVQYLKQDVRHSEGGGDKGCTSVFTRCNYNRAMPHRYSVHLAKMPWSAFMQASRPGSFHIFEQPFCLQQLYSDV